MSENENASAPADVRADYTPEEKAYLETRGGEKPAPAETSAEAPSTPAEPSADAAPAPTKEQKQDMVPHAALHEARLQNKQQAERIRQFELEQARMAARLDAIMRPQQAPKPPPSPDEDIFGAAKHANQRIERLEQDARARAQYAQQQQAVNQLLNWGGQQQAEFKKDTPDYDAALAHLRAARASELSALGYTDPEIGQALNQEEIALVSLAHKRNANPAELAYKMAKARGYVKKAEAQATEKDMAKQLDRIEAGMAASKSLSNVGGSAGGGELSAMDILKMPEDEFDAWKRKNPAKYRRALGSPN